MRNNCNDNLIIFKCFNIIEHFIEVSKVLIVNWNLSDEGFVIYNIDQITRDNHNLICGNIIRYDNGNIYEVTYSFVSSTFVNSDSFG